MNHAWCCRFAVAASCLNAYASVCRLMCAECRPCFLSLVWWYRRTNERKRNYKKLVVISFFLPRALLRLTVNFYSLLCAKKLAHGEDFLCREFLVCRESDLWLSVKSYLCRVFDGMHTTKSPAHGIARDSGSEASSSVIIYI